MLTQHQKLDLLSFILLDMFPKHIMHTINNKNIQLFIIHANSCIFYPLAFKNNVYIKRMVIVHLTQNISHGLHAVTTFGVIYATQYYVGHNQFPSTRKCRLTKCGTLVNICKSNPSITNQPVHLTYKTGANLLTRYCTCQVNCLSINTYIRR